LDLVLDFCYYHSVVNVICSNVQSSSCFIMLNLAGHDGFGFYICSKRTWHTCDLHQCSRKLNLISSGLLLPF